MVKRGDAAKRIMNVVNALREEADNISPFHDNGSGGNSHPAPAMRKWAKYLEAVSKSLEVE